MYLDLVYAWLKMKDYDSEGEHFISEAYSV